LLSGKSETPKGLELMRQFSKEGDCCGGTKKIDLVEKKKRPCGPERQNRGKVGSQQSRATLRGKGSALPLFFNW